METRRLAVPLCLGLLAAPATAVAQRRQRAERTQESGLASEADARFRQGIALAGEDNFPAALVEFRRAHEVSRNPLLLFNIAAMQVELNRFDEGLEALTEYERAAPAAIVQARRASLDALRERIVTRSGTVVISRPVPDLRVEFVAIDRSAQRIVREGPRAAATRVPVGRYRIQLSAPGHDPLETELDVPGNLEVRIDQALRARSANLQIRSNVQGAQVRIDGSLVGTTPLPPQTVSEGVHRIEVTRAGYSSFTIAAAAQGALGVIDANLEWLPAIPQGVAGRVGVQRNYPSLECQLDGRSIGCDGGDLVPPGEHLFRAAGRDYVPFEQRVNLPAGEVSMLNPWLQPTNEALRESRDAVGGARRTAFIIGGLGLAGVVGGLVWVGSAIGAVSALSAQEVRATTNRDQCLESGQLGSAMCFQTWVARREMLDNETGQQLIGGGIALGVVAVSLVAVGTGTVLYFTGPRDRFATPPPARFPAQPRVTATLGGLRVQF
jgi:hypothetical protein